MDGQMDSCYRQNRQQYGVYGDASDPVHDTGIDRALFCHHPDLYGLLLQDGSGGGGSSSGEASNMQYVGRSYADGADGAVYGSLEDEEGGGGGFANAGFGGDGLGGYSTSASYCFGSNPEDGIAEYGVAGGGGLAGDETVAADDGLSYDNISTATYTNTATTATATTTTATRPSAYRFRHDLPVATDWEPLQPLLQQLYMVQGLSLRDVAEIMREQHQFSATERMYKHQFKKWKWQKYRPKEKKDKR